MTAGGWKTVWPGSVGFHPGDPARGGSVWLVDVGRDARLRLDPGAPARWVQIKTEYPESWWCEWTWGKK